MKKFSKILCLVLVVVMMAGLCAVGTSAAYADADKITYTEAVDVLSAVGVLQGDDRGFRPADGLTRAEACKIIAYLDGAEDISATPTFTDSKNHWAADFIAYCASQGYVNGVGNNKFAPDAALTGSAFAKMLLGVLGYDASIEGMTGDTWEVAVARLVKSTELSKGIAKFVGASNVTREQAAQLGMNALKTDMVEYASKGTQVTINGAAITTGASKPTAVTAPAGTLKYATIGTTTEVGTGKQYVQLGEELYDGRLSMDTTPVNGVAGHTWKLKANANAVALPISKFVATENVLGTSSDNTALYATTGKSLTYKSNLNSKFIAQVDYTTLNTTFEVYVNGAKVTATSAAASTYWWDAATKLVKYGTPGTDVNGYGVLYTLIDTDNNAATAEKIYVTTYKVGVLNKDVVVKTNAVDGKDYIYIDFNKSASDIGTTAVNTVLASKVTGYEGLVKGDVVTVVALADGTYQITKCEPNKTTMTAQSGSTLTLNGVAVKAAAAAESECTSNASASAAANYYYDAYGYGIYTKAITATSSDYLLTTSVGDFNTTIGATGNKAQVVLDNGTKATITVNAVDTKTWGKTLAAGDISDNTVYAYTVNEDGSYNLISVTAKNGTGATITKGVATTTVGGGTAVTGNNETKYVVYNTATQSYTTYVGYTNVPSVNSATYYGANNALGYAAVVFVPTNTPVTASSTDVAYLLGTTATTVYKANGTVDYYTFPAIIKGEVTVLKTASADLTQYNSGSNPDGLGNGGAISAKTLVAVQYSDGVVAANGLTTLTAANGIVEVTSTTIGEAKDTVLINTTYYNYTDATKVYVISADGLTVDVADMTGYDEGTYTITGVTASYGKYATATAAEKITLTEIYLQK